MGTGWQSPTAPSSLHDTHEAPHADPQHTPSAQDPEAHSVPAVHSAPLNFLPQLPATHLRPGAQSASDPHAPKHLCGVPPALQPNGAHVTVGPSLHAPLPSHTLAEITAAPSHLPARQSDPDGYSSQPPRPSHMPSSPQPAAPSSLHSPGRAGGSPPGTSVHVPFDPGTLHALHGVPHSVLQQIPSAQIAEAHSTPHAHLPPIAVRTAGGMDGHTGASGPRSPPPSTGASAFWLPSRSAAPSPDAPPAPSPPGRGTASRS